MTTRLAGAFAICLCSTVAWAQQPHVFDAGNGMLLNYVRPDRTADFEAVMARVAAGLAESEDPMHQAMAEGWQVLRAREPGPNNSVLYVWWMAPVEEGANYEVSHLLDELYPEEAQDLWRRFSGAFGGGQAIVNLDAVMRSPEMHASPANTQSSTAPARAEPSPKPTPPAASAPPPSSAVDGSALTIVEIDARVTERNNTWWKFAWKLTVRNNSSSPQQFDATIEFQDGDGFVVDDDDEYNLVVPANGERTFTGYDLIDADIASNVRRTVAKGRR